MVISEEAIKIINTVRDLFVQAGGRPLGKPEEYGCNSSYHSTQSEFEFVTDSDHRTPVRLRTPQGEYVILGSFCPPEDVETFWASLTEVFEMELLKTVMRNYESYSIFSVAFKESW